MHSLDQSYVVARARDPESSPGIGRLSGAPMMLQRSYFYRWAGLVLASPFEIPELECIPSSPNAAQIRVRLDTNGDRRAPAAAGGDFRRFRVGSDGRIIFCPPRVGRFVIHRGGLIDVYPHREATAEAVRACLIGPALAAAAYQRQWLVLHACAIAVGDEAMMFVGPSGAGKSTIAAFLASNGYPLFGDDVCILSAGVAGVELRPSHHSLKLDGRSLSALERAGLDLSAVRINARRRGKTTLRLPVPGCERTLFVRHVYSIKRDPSIMSAGIRSIGGIASLAAIADNCYRPQIVGLLGSGSEHLQRCTALHRQAKVFELRVPHGHHRLRELMPALTQHWAAPQHPANATTKGFIGQL